MALFNSVFRQLFECFVHFLRREGTPQRAQQCAEQELAAVEKLPEECEAFDLPANDRKCRRRRRKVVHSLEKLMEGGSELREAGEKKRKERKRKERMITEPMPLLVVVKPLPTTVRCSFLKPIEGEPPMVTSVSGHLALPVAGFKPLPPVTKPPMHPQKPAPAPEDVLSLPCSALQVDPPKLLAVPQCLDEVVSLQHSSSQMLPLAVPPSPTPAHDEVVAQRRPPSRKPEPFTSLFEPPPQLMLVDIEDEENKCVEYTGRTTRTSALLKSERPQTPEAEIKPRKMVAWLEKDSEVQQEAWASEGAEVQELKEEEGDPSEMGDSKAIQGHADDASQIDELMMKLFCVASSDSPNYETQHNMNVQKKCNRKEPFFLFTWAEEKIKNRKEKKIIKEKERREKQLLLERYIKDPKLKHLWINKHNRNYNSS